MRALICANCKSPQDPDERDCPVCQSSLTKQMTDEEILRSGGVTVALRPTAKLVVKRP